MSARRRTNAAVGAAAGRIGDNNGDRNHAMIEVTEEELERRRQGEVLDRLHEATVRGDEAEQRLWEAQLAPSAEILMRAKRVMGSDWLRRQAYTTCVMPRRSMDRTGSMTESIYRLQVRVGVAVEQPRESGGTARGDAAEGFDGRGRSSPRRWRGGNDPRSGANAAAGSTRGSRTRRRRRRAWRRRSSRSWSLTRVRMPRTRCTRPCPTPGTGRAGWTVRGGSDVRPRRWTGGAGVWLS